MYYRDNCEVLQFLGLEDLGNSVATLARQTYADYFGILYTRRLMEFCSLPDNASYLMLGQRKTNKGLSHLFSQRHLV
jgi:hypothetical protein